MAIGDQFAGLDMKNLIGGPLVAAAESSINLAQSTADFINTVGFNEDKSARTMMFKFEKSDTDPLGNPLRSQMQLEVPLLAIVPIPNLQVDEVNILFDMEVKQCEKSESSRDMSGSFSGSVGIGFIKASISGSVSSHSSNTRSTDNSAKYHVDVRAVNHGMPEGLARVLDIMAAAAAPSLLASKMVDGDGKEVNAVAKEKRAKLQASYAEQQGLGTACKAVSDEYEASLKGLQDCISRYNKSEKLKIQAKLNTLPEPEPADTRATYTTLMHSLDSLWERVSQDARATVETVYDVEVSGTASSTNATPGAADTDGTSGTTATPAATSMIGRFDMQKVNVDTPALVPVVAADITVMNSFFSKAVQYYKDFKAREKALAEARISYNTLLMTK
jgi:hypothetical protein